MEFDKTIWETCTIKIKTASHNGVFIYDNQTKRPVGHLTDGQLKDIIKTLIIEKVI